MKEARFHWCTNLTGHLSDDVTKYLQKQEIELTIISIPVKGGSNFFFEWIPVEALKLSPVAGLNLRASTGKHCIAGIRISETENRPKEVPQDAVNNLLGYHSRLYQKQRLDQAEEELHSHQNLY